MNMPFIRSRAAVSTPVLLDRLIAFGGSWFFVISLIVAMSAWVAANQVVKGAIDPYPFIALNLALALLAIIQTSLVMRKMREQADLDHRRAERIMEDNRRAKAEIASLHRKIDYLIAAIPLSKYFDNPVDLVDWDGYTTFNS